MRETVIVAAKPTQQGTLIYEMDDLGNELTVLETGSENVSVSCGGKQAIIVFDGLKYKYDFSNGFGQGYLCQI